MSPTELLNRSKDTAKKAKTLQSSITVPVGVQVVTTHGASSSATAPVTNPAGTVSGVQSP